MEILLGPLTFPKSNWLAGAFLLVTFELYFMLKKVKFQLDDLHLVAISISYIFLLISSILGDLMKYTKVVSVFAALLAVLFHFLIEDGLPAIKQRTDIKNKKLDTSYELTETWQKSLKMVDLFNINVATAYSLMPMLKNIHGIYIFWNNILLITMFIVAIEFLVEGLFYMLCEHVFRQHIDLLDKMVKQKKE